MLSNTTTKYSVENDKHKTNNLLRIVVKKIIININMDIEYY